MKDALTTYVCMLINFSVDAIVDVTNVHFIA
jgi:hypothetical protein